MLLCLLIAVVVTLAYELQPVEAKPVKTDAVLVCFSGGQEIVRKTVVEGPFADEYKFAHEVKVVDEQGEHQLNFAGGLCIIDRGAVTVKSQPELSDRLSCYSGGKKVIDFEVYGRETTVDEYLEGRTFVAKARGKAFNYDSLHQYLVFGGGACLGEET
jgi:hypothetical protein